MDVHILPLANAEDNYVQIPKEFYTCPRNNPHKVPRGLPVLNVERTEYQMQLDRALMMRLNQNWPLIPFEDWGKFKMDDWYWHSLPEEQRPVRIFYESTHYVLRMGTQEILLGILKNRFPCVFTLMKLHPGKISPCGGFFTNPFLTNDIDLFFVGCSEKEAEDIMLSFEEMFTTRHILVNQEIKVERTVGTTSFNIVKDDDNKRSYQFIHRIYPSLAHVLGGFDLSASMFGFDGTNIVANPMGAWAWVNRTIVVDISRRSLSFNHRLFKYKNRGFDIIFPGINQNTVFSILEKKEKDLEIFNSELQMLKEKHGIVLGGSVSTRSSKRYDGEGFYDDYGYGMTLNGKDGRLYTSSPDSTLEGFDLRINENSDKKILSLCHEPNIYRIREPSKDYENEAPRFDGSKKSNLLAIYKDKPDTIKGLGFYLDGEKPLAEGKITFKENYGYGDVQNFFVNMLRISHQEVREINFDELEELLDEHSPSVLKVNWITQDPGRQWSSTVNPAIIKAQKFYKGAWNGCTAKPFWDYPTFKLMLLASRFDPNSSLYRIPCDVLKLIDNLTAWC